MARRKARKGRKKGTGRPKGKTEVAATATAAELAATALNRIISQSQVKNKDTTQSSLALIQARVSARSKKKTEKGAALSKSTMDKKQTEKQEMRQQDTGMDEKEMKQEQDENNNPPEGKDEKQEEDDVKMDLEEEGQNIMQQQKSIDNGNLKLGKVKKLYGSSEKSSYLIYPDNHGTQKVTSSTEIEGLENEFQQFLSTRMQKLNDERITLEAVTPTFFETFKFIEDRVPSQVYIPNNKLLETTSSFYNWAVREMHLHYCKMDNQRVPYPYPNYACEKNFPAVSNREDEYGSP